MGTTIDKLNKVQETKAAIKQAIIDKGIDVSDDTIFADYPTKIRDIKSGSSEEHNHPDFFDTITEDGTKYQHLFYRKTESQMPDVSSWDTSKVTDMMGAFESCFATTLDLRNWNTSNVLFFSGMFKNCDVESLDLSTWNTDKLLYTNSMFEGCSDLTSLNLKNWNTSNVVNMSSMFTGCRSLTTIDGLYSWDTRNVDSMYAMFQNCAKLISLNLVTWSTDKLTNMSYMFSDCSDLMVVDISNWNTSNVTNMDYIFSGCESLTDIVGEIDASGLKNGLYPGSHNHQFKNCTSLETLYLKNIYKNSTIPNDAYRSKYSINLADTKVKDECLIYIINELPDLINDKGLTYTSDIVFTLPPTNTLTSEQVQVAIDKGWTVANTNF